MKPIGLSQILGVIALALLNILLAVAIVNILTPAKAPLVPATPTLQPPTLTPTASSTPAPTAQPTAAPSQTAIPQPSPTPTAEMAMGLVPAGEFSMGETELDRWPDTRPVHKVSLEAFSIDVYEVTNERYAACVMAGVCLAPLQVSSASRENYYSNPEFANYPVIQVTWEMAQTYCQWRGGSLPSEAQWEKAARGGLEQKPCPWGVQSPVCKAGAPNGARFDNNTTCKNADTAAVGTYSPNSFGLYDMVGNVSEWVLDWYSATYYTISPLENPLGPDSGTQRIVRGGSWRRFQAYLRTFTRQPADPAQGADDIGFRCVRAP